MAHLRPTAAGALAIAIGIAAAVGCTPNDETSHPPEKHRTSKVAHADVHGPNPPADGAWIGAAVVPQVYTPPGRTRAYREFERATGRKLDVVHTYHRWRDPFPDVTDERLLDSGHELLTGWAASDCPGIAAGEYDGLIRQRAKDVKELGRPIMMAFRWEMDRPNLRPQVQSAEDYVAAWKRTRRIFAEVGATNVGWVWAPTALGFTEGYAQAFYPGDDQVDWIAVDAYTGMRVKPFATVMSAFTEFAERRPAKPVMIAEFGLSARGGARPDWLDAARGYVKRHPQIKAVLYFNGDMNDGPTRQFAVDDAERGRAAFHRWLADRYFNTGDRDVRPPR